jgi:hypothetical protein
VCADAPSQTKIVNFTLSLIEHARLNGVVIPDLFYTQPPYHASLGNHNSTYNISGAFLGAVPQIDVTISLDVFYFGTRPYFARDYLEGAGTSLFVWILIAVIAVIVFAFAITLCVPAGRSCLKNCCPRCCCSSGCCHSW